MPMAAMNGRWFPDIRKEAIVIPFLERVAQSPGGIPICNSRTIFFFLISLGDEITFHLCGIRSGCPHA